MADNHSGGTYPLDWDVVDRDAVRTAVQGADLPYAVDEADVYRSADPDLVRAFAYGSDDDQPVHVDPDYDDDNVVNGALTLGWLLDTLDREDVPVRGVDRVFFQEPVRYDANGVDPAAVVDRTTTEDGRTEPRYDLDVRTGDSPTTAVTLTPDIRETDRERAVTPLDHAEVVAYTIGSFFDRTRGDARGGDVLMAVEDVAVFTPVDEMVDGADRELHRAHVRDVESGPLYEALGDLAMVREYHNDIRPVDSGQVDAKLETTVVEPFTDDDQRAILSG